MNCSEQLQFVEGGLKVAKLKSDSIKEEDIKEYMNNYSDFSFELKVLSRLNSLGFSCQHGGVYKDPITEKIREFDIRAYKDDVDQSTVYFYESSLELMHPIRKKMIETTRVAMEKIRTNRSLRLPDDIGLSLTASEKFIEGTANYRIHLAVECKNLRESFPLVTHCIPRKESESFYQIFHNFGFRETNISLNLIDEFKKRTDTLLPSFERVEIYTLTSRQDLYSKGEPVAKSCNQVGRDANGAINIKDETFDRISQAINSAHDLVENCYFTEQNKAKHYFTFIIPVLVIPDGMLWQIAYDENGTHTGGPKKINAISHYIGQPWTIECKGESGATYTISHLEIVTFSELEAFVNKLIPKNFSDGGFFEDIAMDNPKALSSYLKWIPRRRC